MVPNCVTCGSEFDNYPVIDGTKLNLHGRLHCINCKPLRRLQAPREPVVRRRAVLICKACGNAFAAKVIVDGKLRSFYGRSFCLTCSPFETHNTSKSPLGISSSDDLAEIRRRKRNAKNYRWQKKQRRQRKISLVRDAGGRCVDCGYSGPESVFEFHHRDPSTKDFEVWRFSGPLAQLVEEVRKCDLLCANCHRRRHAVLDATHEAGPAVEYRRRRKARAVAYMGSCCQGCGINDLPAIFEFHHWDARQKEFGFSERGIPRAWKKMITELQKCVMLCVNCHREVHAGVRELDRGLAEDAVAYVA
jgi:hypothetical protein